MAMKVSVLLTADSSGLVGELRIGQQELDKLGRETREAGQEARSASQGMDRMSHSARQSIPPYQRLNRTISTLRAGIAALGIGLAAREFVRLSDVATQLESRLRLVTGSAEELAAVQQRLFDISQESRTSFEATSTLFFRVARSQEELGRSTGQILQFTETIQKLAVASGATAQEATNAVIQLSQGLASGQVRGEELRSVMEQLPAVAQAAAKGLGLTLGEFRERSLEGQIQAQEFFDAILRGSEDADAQFSQLERTVAQAMQQLRNQMIETARETNESSDATDSLVDAIDELRGIIGDEDFITGFSFFVTIIVDIGRQAAEAVGHVGELVTALKELDAEAILRNQLDGSILGRLFSNAPGNPGSLSDYLFGREIGGNSLIGSPELGGRTYSSGSDSTDSSANENTSRQTGGDVEKTALMEIFERLSTEVHEANFEAGIANRGGRERTGLRAVYEAQEAAHQDYLDGLRESPALLEAEEEAARSAALAIYDANEARETRTQLEREAAGIIESQTTAQEAYNSALSRYRLLLDEGLISHDQYVQAIADAREELEGAEDGLMRFSDISADLTDTIGTGLEDAALKGKDLRDVIQGLNQDLQRMVLRRAVTKPFESITGGLLDSLFSFDFFGSSGTGSALSGPGGAPGISFGGPRALGGDVRDDSFYLVGERGPELFAPSTPGRIIPNRELSTMRGGGHFGGENGPQIQINVDAPGGDTVQVRRSVGQAAAELSRIVDRGKRYA